MKQIFVLSFFLLVVGLQAQTNKSEGIIDKITDNQLVISHLSSHPKVGQKVTVDKKFQNGMFSGIHSLAEGTVTKVAAHEVEIKVSNYTSTLVEDGKKRPMAKLNDHAIIKWEGESEQLTESSSDKKEVLEKLQNTIYEAQALIKKRQYKDAVELLKPEVSKWTDCWSCHYVLGQAYYELHEEEKAIFQMTKVIDNAGEKYSMAYIWRARAYADNYPHQYEKAIEDYRLVSDKYAKKEGTKTYIIKEIVEIQDKMKDFDAACKSVKEIQKIEGENGDNKDMYNHYCLGIKVPKKKHIRFDGYVTEQSEDQQTFTVKLSDNPEVCYYSEYFDGEPDYTESKDLKVGDYVEVSTCSEGGKMGIAVVKITGVNDGSINVEVMYWTNKINGHPWKRTFKKDKPFTFAW